jgi:uncharacterized OsmC-like protein
MEENVYYAKAESYSSGTPGRTLMKVRGNHFVSDDPDHPRYGGPGEAPGAGELFLSGITSCAVLMLERIARKDELPLERVHVAMEASRDIDSGRQPPTFDSARMTFTLWGLTDEQAGQLVETFKRR